MKTSTRQAKYMPDDKIIYADSVKSYQKSGPWSCSGDECGMPLIYVEATRRHRVGGGTVDVHPFFRRAKNNQHHSDTCSLYGVPPLAIPRLDTGSSMRNIPLNRVFLITHGEKPVIAAAPSTPGDRPARNFYSTENYAGRISQLAQLIEKKKLRGEAWMKKYYYRHNGANYTWDEFVYSGKHEDFERLYETVSEIVNPNSLRPWIIFGVLQGGFHEVDHKPNRRFLLIASKDKGVVPKVRAFFDLTENFLSTTNSLKDGDRVVVLLSNVEKGTGAHGVIGDLASPVDLIVQN